MTDTARLLRFAVPALGLLAAACTNHPSSNTAASHANPPGVTNTAPNVNNPYATDPLDPNMNPEYMRGDHR
ncbi:MAG TPA: hypothetical protein VGB82_06760 [Alphaproteobacteria bacterium]